MSVDSFEHQQSIAIFFGLVNKILTEHMWCVQTVFKDIHMCSFCIHFHFSLNLYANFKQYTGLSLYVIILTQYLSGYKDKFHFNLKEMSGIIYFYVI